MPALSAQLTTEFCKLCDWAFQCWLNHRHLFDENPRADELRQSKAGYAFDRLSIISQEYSLLQVTKLHDKAVVAGNVTLGIEYVTKYGGWDPAVQAKLKGLADRLNDFAKNLRAVRNCLLSHNDLAAVLSGAPLGSFTKGEDNNYFTTLQEFVDVVHDQVIGGPYPFNNLVKTDVRDFLSMLG